MDSEASTSSSPSGTDLSTMNATTSDEKKRGGSGRKRQRQSHPFYRGVRRRSCGKWVSEMPEPSKKSRIRLGTFPNPEMAAAKLNFPDSAHRLPQVASSAHADIQRAAREFTPPNSMSHNAGDVDSEKKNITNINVVLEDEEFVDEEAMFNMPLLVDCMAEGMLLTPPALKKGFRWSQHADHAEEEEEEEEDDHTDFTLWEH